jgi:hypothetical protein
VPRETLLTSAQQTTTSALLIDAARARGIEVREGGNLYKLQGHAVHWYGGPESAARAAKVLDLQLLEPPEDWLTTLPKEFVGRRIELTTAASARALQQPIFLKPPRDKTFPAAVYDEGSQLPGLPPGTPVLVSEVVSFAAEYRLFALDNEFVTGSRYATYGRLDAGPMVQDAQDFAAQVLHGLPSAVVVDVGLIQNPTTGERTWAVVEANMPWFAQSYAADPERVLDVVLRATGPLEQFSIEDRKFLSGFGECRLDTSPE